MSVNEKAGIIFQITPITGKQIQFDLRFDERQSDTYIERVNPATNRITFADNLSQITIIDAGGVQMIRRRIPGICKPFEIGIPPPTPRPAEGIKIRYKDKKGEPVVILGLQSPPILQL